MKERTDEQCWLDFQQGDRRAYQLLYERYATLLFSYASKFTTDRELVRDVIQELFVELWLRRERLAPAQSVRFYLMRSLKNNLIRALRQQQRHRSERSADDPEVAFRLPPVEAYQLADAAQEEQLERLQRAMELLSPQQREAIYLRFFAEMNLDEIAQVLGIHYQSVANLLHRALQRLRKHLTVLISLSSL